ncbi:MAG: peptidoglycan DD-metalloendopeptidase family protein [Bacteroidales bacterium]|nr:peptidoglycan DD-metalloendopeptidase family protein [Bacteroidales bacterium]
MRRLFTIALLMAAALPLQAQKDTTKVPEYDEVVARYIALAEGRDTTEVEIPGMAGIDAYADSLDLSGRPDDIAPFVDLFARGEGSPVDTLDVGDSRYLIVLRDDNTWTIVKNTAALENDDNFTRSWNTHLVNPYRDPLDSIPYRVTICLVDSISRFVCPYQRKVFSKFGLRHGRRHTGADIPYPTGTPVKCAFDGRVRLAERHKGYGNLIIVRHENGLETFYAHLSEIQVKVGDWVHAGDQIALGGSTGRSSGPHLHFETRYKGNAFDPEWIIDFENGKLRKNAFVLRRSYLSAYSKYVPENIDDEEELYMTEEQIKAEEERIAKERAAMKYHTIKSGDTLSGIAVKYGTTVSKICSLNQNLKPTTVLSLGRKIRVK